MACSWAKSLQMIQGIESLTEIAQINSFLISSIGFSSCLFWCVEPRGGLGPNYHFTHFLSLFLFRKNKFYFQKQFREMTPGQIGWEWKLLSPPQLRWMESPLWFLNVFREISFNFFINYATSNGTTERNVSERINLHGSPAQLFHARTKNCTHCWREWELNNKKCAHKETNYVFLKIDALEWWKIKKLK